MCSIADKMIKNKQGKIECKELLLVYMIEDIIII
jgi:hypothetical protein